MRYRDNKQIIQSKKWANKFLPNRLHYFLISSAFLVTAFVNLMMSDHPVYLLVHLVAALGLSISLIFFQMNYRASMLIDKNLDYYDLRWEEHFQNSTLISRQLIRDVWHLVCNPVEFASTHDAIHYWVIPFGFGLFWTLTWSVAGWELYSNAGSVAGMTELEISKWFWVWPPFMYYVALILSYKIHVAKHKGFWGSGLISIILCIVSITVLSAYFDLSSAWFKFLGAINIWIMLLLLIALSPFYIGLIRNLKNAWIKRFVSNKTETKKPVEEGESLPGGD